MNRPVDCWKLRTCTLEVGNIPLLMGIVNVTPDSFSDDGQFFDAAAGIFYPVAYLSHTPNP